MRPGVVLVGFVFGSAAGITFSLFGVLVVYLVLRSEQPRFAAEIAPLLTHLALFAALTAAAAVTFYAELRQLAWRAPCRVVLVGALAGLIAFYWPR
ncbi:MAG TPA: hypothetical protein VIC71_12775 [Gammaproteobacteria bacterium]|jgi:hypothetical protein